MGKLIFIVICIFAALNDIAAGRGAMVFAIVVGICVYYGAKAMAEQEKRANAEREQKERDERKNKALLEVQQREEQRRKDDRTRTLVREFESEYSLAEYRLPQGNLSPAQRSTVPGGLSISNKNRDVSACFDLYYEALIQIDTEIFRLQNKAKEILNYPVSSSEEKLKYLQSRKIELDSLKIRAKQLYFEESHKKIHITNFDSTPLTKLRNAIIALENSDKLVSLSDTPAEVFFQCDKPKELEYFHSSVTPVVLNFDKIKAFCYPKIVLLFEGMHFLAGINPDELKIAVSQKEETARYYFNRNDYKDNRFLGNDSFVVKKGFERTTWLHTCKDGSPDLRYSYNPATHFRDDVVRYGIVRFFIGKHCAEFAFSSYQAYEALITAQNSYCINNTIPKDPLPELLDLLDCLGCNSDVIQEMRNQQLIHKEKDLPVCRIIESRTS